jgi:hypothetical protein
MDRYQQLASHPRISPQRLPITIHHIKSAPLEKTQPVHEPSTTLKSPWMRPENTRHNFFEHENRSWRKHQRLHQDVRRRPGHLQYQHLALLYPHICQITQVHGIETDQRLLSRSRKVAYTYAIRFYKVTSSCVYRSDWRKAQLWNLEDPWFIDGQSRKKVLDWMHLVVHFEVHRL